MRPGHPLGRIGVRVELDALDERRGAVAHSDDGHADLLGLVARCAVDGTVVGHG